MSRVPLHEYPKGMNGLFQQLVDRMGYLGTIMAADLANCARKPVLHFTRENLRLLAALAESSV